MKITLTISLLFLTTILLGQNRHLSLGLKKNGICFGNSADYNGIRLNLWDKNVNSINGVNISGFSESKKSNGLSISIVGSSDSISNGLKIGGLVTWAQRHNGIALAGLLLEGQKYNGIAVAGLFSTGQKYNGIGLSGLSPFGDTLNGLFVGLFGVVSWNAGDTIKVINGIAIGGTGVFSLKINGLAISLLQNSFDKQNGVSISCINKAKELHGFQFGLLNYAGNNRRLFRWTPFINFNLRKNASK
jgi:hypothetical protein